MPPAAAIAVPAALGVLGGVSQAREQRKYAEEAGKPRPYHSTTTQGPPAWLLPFIQGGMQSAQENYALQRDNPRLPPTFADITSGRYGSPLPTSALGGIQPGNVSPRVERAWAANAAKQDRELTDRERQKIAERVLARHPEAAGGGAPAAGGRPRRRGGGVGAGMGSGGRGGGGAAAGPRQAFAQMLLERAQRPVPGIEEGMGFIQGLLGRQGPDLSALNRGLDQQAQTFADFRSPAAPINQMIQRGMGPGFSSAAPFQRQLAGNLYGRMNAPPPALPTARFQGLMDLANDPNLNFGFEI